MVDFFRLFIIKIIVLLKRIAKEIKFIYVIIDL